MVRWRNRRENCKYRRRRRKYGERVKVSRKWRRRKSKSKRSSWKDKRSWKRDRTDRSNEEYKEKEKVRIGNGRMG